MEYLEFIAHRINTVKELVSLNEKYGAEVDLRDDLNGRIYIQHNPFEDGENFSEYIKNYKHGTLVLNIKSERIEYNILELLKKYNVSDYFFLDCSFPMINLLSGQEEKNIALRVSEFEGIDTAENMSGRIRWIWVDCFTKFPLSYNQWERLKHLGYKVCFVSPELQGRPDDIEQYANQIKNAGIEFDAICTKSYYIEKWCKLLGTY